MPFSAPCFNVDVKADDVSNPVAIFMLGILCLFYFLIYCHEFMTRLTILCCTKLLRESRTTELTFSTLLKCSYCGTDAQPLDKCLFRDGISCDTYIL